MYHWYSRLIKSWPVWARYAIVLLVVLPLAFIITIIVATYRLTIGNIVDGLGYLSKRKHIGDKSSWTDEKSRNAYNVPHIEKKLGWILLLAGALPTIAVASFTTSWLMLDTSKTPTGFTLVLMLVMLGFMLIVFTMTLYAEGVWQVTTQADTASSNLKRPTLF